MGAPVPPPSAGSPGPASLPPVDAVEVTALAALYQADRADQSQHNTSALTLIAGAVAYLGLVVTAWKDVKAAAMWPVLLPVPLWMVAAFHVLIMGAVLTRNQSIRILEVRLHSATKLPMLGVASHELGGARARQVMDLDRQPILLKVQTLVTYMGIGCVLFGFTAYAVWNTWHHHGWDTQVRIAAGAYSIAAALVLAAWIRILLYLEEPLPAWAQLP